MVSVGDIRWSSYLSYEGPIWLGSTKLNPILNPTTVQKQLMVLMATESGGHVDAINEYDRMIVSVGLIQYGEASQFSVSDILGQICLRDPSLLDPLQPALQQSNTVFKPNGRNRYRFFFQDGRGEVRTIQDQQHLFLLHSNGLKGSWDDPSRLYAKEWAACLANVLAQPEAQLAQVDFITARLRGFATSAALNILWGPGDPSFDTDGWVGAMRAAYISFAANLPAVASSHLLKAMTKTTASKWSPDWCVQVLQELTFGPNIAIYPARYNAIRPVIENLYGVDLPDFSSNLQAWHAQNSIDPSASPNFLTVQSVQQELIDEGYDLGPAGADGIEGAKTVEALRTFQKKYGLSADGVVGVATRSALVSAYKNRTGTA